MQDTVSTTTSKGGRGKTFTVTSPNSIELTTIEVTEIVIFEARVAMHHATNAQVQNAGI